MIYIISLIPFVATSILGIVEKRNNKFFLFVLAVFLMLFASLRNGVGIDWAAYHSFYVYSVNNVEIGYSFLNNTFADFGFPFFVFLFAINCVSIGLLTKSALKFSAIPIVSLMIYYSDPYLYFNFSGMRQALAISITTFALIYSFNLKRNKYIYFALICVAMSFHISAVIAAVAYFIPQRRFKKKEIIILVITFTFFSSFVYFASSFLTGIFASKAEFYLEHQEQSQNIQMLFIIGLLRRFITVILIYIFGWRLFFNNNISAYLFNLYIVGLGIFAASYLVSPDIGVRLSIYFTVLEMFLLANLIYTVKKMGPKFILFAIVVSVSLYKLYTYTLIPYYNYQSIL